MVKDKLIRYVPKPVRSELRGTVAEEVYARYRFRRSDFVELRVPMRGETIPIDVPSDSFLINHLDDEKEYEPGLTSELADALGEDIVFYDVGCRYGAFTKFALENGVPPSNVVGFEADRYSFLVLRRNHTEQGVTLVNSFVGRDDGRKSISLDRWSETNRTPDVIKIDVEGAEFDVIRGMGDLLRTVRPLVFVEVHPQHLSRPTDSLIDEFGRRGYELTWTNHRDHSASWQDISSTVLPSTEEFLLRAVPSSEGT